MSASKGAPTTGQLLVFPYFHLMETATCQAGNTNNGGGKHQQRRALTMFSHGCYETPTPGYKSFLLPTCTRDSGDYPQDF